MKINNKIIRLKRYDKSLFHCVRSAAILFTLVLVLSLSILTIPVMANINPEPTFDLDTDSHLSGATNAIYTFTMTNIVDSSTKEQLKQITVTIPSGYTINPDYITTTAGKRVGTMTMSGGGDPHSADFVTTNTERVFTCTYFDTLCGTLTLSADSRTVTLVIEQAVYGLARTQGVLKTIPGFFINPTTAGIYSWSAKALGYGESSTEQDCSPRDGYSQDVQIGLVHNQTTGVDYSTIQAAISDASTGDTIIVAAGTYDEHIVINKDNLTLLGAQHDVDPRPSFGGRSGDESVIRPYITWPLYNTVLIEADNVVLNGFTISPDFAEGYSADVDIVKQNDEHSGTTVKYNIVTFTGRYYAGDDLIQLKHCTDGVIEYNYGHDIKGNAFNFAYSTNCSIQYNEAHHCGMVDHPEWGGAIYTYDSTNVDLIGNKIYDSLGITFGTTVNWPTLRNTGGTIKDNTVYNATFGGLEIYADDVLVEGNEIYNCNESAVKIIGANVTVQNNNLHDNNVGILVKDEDPISSTNISAHWNNIEGNTEYGVKNEAAALLGATHNWWGAASGPTHASNPGGTGDAVSDNVDFVPFLSPNITLTKTGPTTAYQGNNIIYTITYKNVGTFNATNIVVTETYPSEVEFVSSTPAPDKGTNNQWTIGTLAPEQEGTITITVHIK